jgi:hypothetical protein
MKLTAYHPVLLDGTAHFPVELCGGLPAESCVGYVYDVVLKNRALIASPCASGAIFAATFGHTVTLGCFAHAYFGSERVVQDLQAVPGWASGLVVLDGYEFVRADDAEGRVVGMRVRGAPLMSVPSTVATEQSALLVVH